MSRKKREFEFRDTIDAWAADADRISARHWFVLIAVLPFLCVTAVDWLSPRSLQRVALLAAERPSPYERHQETTHEPCVGDLVRKAGLPYYQDLTATETPDRCVLRANSEGYLDNEPRTDRASEAVWIVGSSFMTAGSEPAASFGARLTQATGVATRNRAWPGRGPAYSMLRLLREQGEDELAGTTVVWGLVQRELEAFLYGPLDRALVIDDGDTVRMRAGTDWRGVARRALNWPKAVEGYLQETSRIRASARRNNRYTIPARLDRGASSQVKVGWLEDGRVMLFLAHEVRSGYRNFGTRGGDQIVSVIARVDRLLHSRGAELLIVVIPDKFQTYLPSLRGDSPVLLGEGLPPEVSATTALTDALSLRGIRAVDLLPRLREHALDHDMPYRVEDTHWSDRGIQLAADLVASKQSQAVIKTVRQFDGTN